MRSKWRFSVGVAVAIGVAATASRADDSSFTAELSAPSIALGETVQLTISLNRDDRTAYEGYTRPDFSDFDVLHQGQSMQTQMTIGGGQTITHAVEQHIYLLRPRKKGVIKIPPATARLGGREVHTQALELRVEAAPKHPLPGQPPLTPQQQMMMNPFGAQGMLPGMVALSAPDTMRGDEDLFIEARADKQSAYLGEQVTVSWYLYTRSDILRYRTTAEPKHDDFWSEDLYTPPSTLAWDRAEVKGRAYQVALLLKRALFPLKAGKLVVTPLAAEATTLETAFYPTGSAVRGSKPLTIDVLPLPASGRPALFEATNVGRFEVHAAVDHTSLKAGEALTLKLTLSGEGNIRNVKLRRIEKIDGFRVYEPALTEHVEHDGVLRGERVWTYLLLPERGGDLTIPSVTLPYFDLASKSYQTAGSSPITVHVDGDPALLGQDPRSEASKENVLGPRLRPLRATHHVASRLGERILRGPMLAVALAAPPGLLLAILLGNTVRQGLSRETVGRKRRRARAAARRRLRAAEAALKAQLPSVFFGECVRAIYEHLEYRLGEKCEALTLADLERVLVGRGFTDETAREIVAELESSDFARFAPSASGPSEMRAALKRVRSLLDAIERTRVRGAVA